MRVLALETFNECGGLRYRPLALDRDPASVAASVPPSQRADKAAPQFSSVSTKTVRRVECGIS